MRSLGNHLPGIAALALTLGLIAVAGPAAGASNLAGAHVQQKAHVLIVGNECLPGQQKIPVC